MTDETRQYRTSVVSRVTWLFAILGLLTTSLLEAAEPRKANHEFDFGAWGENQDIEVLNYQYGTSKLTRPEEWELLKGHIGQGTGVSGAMPVGDFLYVKWRILSTEKVYEDRVDLKSRLPSDMNGKIVHFVIKGQQLYVYLIQGNDSSHRREKDAPDCPVPVYKDLQCTELYPEHWINF